MNDFKPVNPHIERRAQEIRKLFRRQDVRTDEMEFFQDRKYERIMKVYVWCTIHNNLVHRKTGAPAPEDIWDFATDYLKERGRKKSHGYCAPCFAEELKKIERDTQ